MDTELYIIKDDNTRYTDKQVLYALNSKDNVFHLLDAIADAYDCTDDLAIPHWIETRARKLDRITDRHIDIAEDVKKFLDEFVNDYSIDGIIEKLIERGCIACVKTGAVPIYAAIFKENWWDFELIREDKLLEYLQEGGHCYVYKTELKWGTPMFFTDFDDVAESCSAKLTTYTDASDADRPPQLVWLLRADKSGYEGFDFEDWVELGRPNLETAREDLQPIKQL